LEAIKFTRKVGDFATEEWMVKREKRAFRIDLKGIGASPDSMRTDRVSLLHCSGKEIKRPGIRVFKRAFHKTMPLVLVKMAFAREMLHSA